MRVSDEIQDNLRVSDAAARLPCGRAASSRGGDFMGGPLVGGLINSRRAPQAKLRDETPSSTAIVALECARAWITAVIHDSSESWRVDREMPISCHPRRSLT